jgi:hypothetical protein
MKNKLLLKSLLSIVFITIFSFVTRAQSTDPSVNVCSGTDDFYKVAKTEGSTYKWTLPPEATPLYGVNNNSDSISVKWATVTKMVSVQIQVVETNKYDYKGEPVVLSVNLYPVPTAVISGSDTLLEGNSGTNKVSIDLTGTAPWEIVYNDGKRDVTVDKIDSAPYSLQTRPLAFPPVEHNFTLVSVTDKSGCTGSVSGAAKIIVVPPVKTGPIIHR